MDRPNVKDRLDSGSENHLVQPGDLDGITIMRYAHSYRGRTSGGVERYLQNLDHGLLLRHRLNILQMYLTRDDTDEDIDVETVGQGHILWVPVAILQTDSMLVDLPKKIGHIYSRTLRLRQRYGDGRYRAIFSSLRNILRHRGGHLRYRTTLLSDLFSDLLVTQDVDLLVLHWLSYDTDALISRALRARIPFVFVNHFDNKRLSMNRIQRWIPQAAGIGTVSGEGIPNDLRSRCVNLSDAVDAEFFMPEKARPIPLFEHPVVLLPARIGDGKGHRDLLQAGHILIERKIDFILCFAGVVDSEGVYRELLGYIANKGLGERVLILGEKNAQELRDWYERSSIVVLPSHSEGLGRVLLEAQAMKKPVVAYDCGGVREALLQNETGFLLKAGDVQGLADKIAFLLENKVEGQLMGDRGREFVSREFSLPALIRRHESFYLRVLSGKGARRRVNRKGHLEYERGRQQVHHISSKIRTDAVPDIPLVSILIPAFNAQEWIADTLRSAIAQTWQRKEVIVVDDGSTDQTVAIARQFESHCVHVVTQANQGAAAARNRAFSLSRGDYIQWLDADDLLAPDKIARQMETLGQTRSKRTLLSSAWGLFMYRSRRAEFVPTALWCDLTPIEWLLRKMGQNLYMQTASWLVSRELTDAAGQWDTRLLSDDDGEYFCRVLVASDGTKFTPEAKCYYRGPGLAFRSLSYIGTSDRKLDAHWLSMQLHIDYLRAMEDSERVRDACLRYLRTSLIYFYPQKPDIVDQAEQMARNLGGQLGPPRLSWKYSWMTKVFGWRAAKSGQRMLLKSRWSVERRLDKALFHIENRQRG
jgi:glycosyltransferase involved in cell wall biosynthesis